MHTVIELPEFSRRSETLLRESEKQGVISYLALHPLSGAIMQGTGGIRKFRWASRGKGKSESYLLLSWQIDSTVSPFRIWQERKSQLVEG